jgi:hypothetical protein
MLTPVLLNATTILLVALLFNYPFRWRRYPIALVRIFLDRYTQASESERH